MGEGDFNGILLWVWVLGWFLRGLGGGFFVNEYIVGIGLGLAIWVLVVEKFLGSWGFGRELLGIWVVEKWERVVDKYFWWKRVIFWVKKWEILRLIFKSVSKKTTL